MNLTPEQEEYIRCLAYIRSFRKANPAAATVARYESGLREAALHRKAMGEKWRKYHREYARKRRAVRREEQRKRTGVPGTFSEITLSDGDRSILVHVWSDGRWNLSTTQPYWGSKPPHRQTAERWIRNGYHGELHEEPEFVRTVFTAIKTRK
jgi:hypothetical protein